MMRFGKGLFLMVLVALTLAVPVFGQSTPGSDNKSASPTEKTTAPAASGGKTGGDGGSSASVPAATPGPSAAPASVPATAPASGTAPASVPATAPASGTAPGATSTSTKMDGSTYQVRLRDLEQRIDELKEQIRRSHTRLSLLSETILAGGAGGARAEITFINDMSSAFRVTQALFVLDGAVQYNKQDETGLLAGQKEIPIFNGSIPPGDHTLQVLVKLRGYGYGVFSYLQGYRFEIRSSHSFTVTEGKTIELKAIAFEKGDVTTPIEQRPAVRYQKNLRTGIGPGTVPGAESKGETDAGERSLVMVLAGAQ